MSVWRLQVAGDHQRLHDVFVDGEPRHASATWSGPRDAGFHAADRLSSTAARLATTSCSATSSTAITLAAGRRAPHEPGAGPGRHLVVVCGPDAGRHVPLPPAARGHIGGPAPTCTSTTRCCRSALPDRPRRRRWHRHCATAGSTNGTSVEGPRSPEPTELHGRRTCRSAARVLAVVDVTRADIAVVGTRRAPSGSSRASTARPSRRCPKTSRRRRPSRHGRRAAAMWWRALLPLVTGFGFAAITGRWIFLLIMIIGPIVMAVEAFRRKRRRERDAGRRGGDLRRRARRVPRERSRPAARGARPASVGSALRRAVAAASRRRGTAGCGSGRPSRRRLHDAFPSAWRRSRRPSSPTTPTSVARASSGARRSRAICCAPVRSASSARPIGRGRSPAACVMNLATTHSPAEVRLWILTTDDGRRRLGVRQVAAAHVRRRRRLPRSPHRDRPGPADQEHQAAARHAGRGRRTRQRAESVRCPCTSSSSTAPICCSRASWPSCSGPARATASSA